MSLLKKISAAAVAAALTLSLVSCGKDTTWGANIDGIQLRAGMLIYFQSGAVSEAKQHMIETDTDVLAITIEDKPARDWINDKVVEDMKEYAAVEKKFDELGLPFDESDKKIASNNVDQWWEYIGEYYESLGVSKQSYLDIAINGEKRSRIFDYYYAEGGELAVPDADIKNYLQENNARIKYIEMPLKDGEGNLLKSEGKAELKKMAEGYIERLKNGESFEAIEKEYDKYYESLVAAASEEQGGEESGSSGEEASENSVTEAVSYGTVIKKDSSMPSVKAAEAAWTLNAGDYTVVEDDNNEVYYIVHRMDLFADETYFDNQRASALNELKGEEFNATVKGWTEGQNVVLNEAAFDRYKLEKHTEE